MKTIFKTLYETHLKNDLFSSNIVTKDFLDEECRVYGELYESLTNPLLTTFRKYCELQEVRKNRENQAAYEQGFKTAIQFDYRLLKPTLSGCYLYVKPF